MIVSLLLEFKTKLKYAFDQQISTAFFSQEGY